MTAVFSLSTVFLTPVFLHPSFSSTPPNRGRPKGSLTACVLVRGPIFLSQAWLAFLPWIFATAAKITLSPLPSCKGHVPGMNPEPPGLDSGLRIMDGTNKDPERGGSWCVPTVLAVPWVGAGSAPALSVPSALWEAEHTSIPPRSRGYFLVDPPPTLEQYWKVQIGENKFGGNSLFNRRVQSVLCFFSFFFSTNKS